MENQIKETLRALGITTNYYGFYRTISAVELVLEDSERLQSVTREIYWVIAAKCGCKRSAVERNIRTVIQRAWRVNPKRLIVMAGYPLSEPPTASEFIEIIANYIERNRA